MLSNICYGSTMAEINGGFIYSLPPENGGGNVSFSWLPLWVS